MKSFDYWMRLLLFTLVAFIVIAEIMIRIMIPDENYNPDLVNVNALDYSPNNIASHVHQPSQTIDVPYDPENPHTLTINSLGYNSPEFSIEKPDNSIRIITLGGSAAFDANARDGRGWVVAMGDYINLDGIAVETINGGVSGYASHHSLAKLHNEVWLYDPDYVAVYHCWNDLKFLRGVQPTSPMLQNNNYDIYSQFKGFLRSNYAGNVDRALGTSHLYLFIRAIMFNPNVTSEGQLRAAPSVEELVETTLSETAIRQYELTLQSIVDFNRRIGVETIFIQQARLVAPDNTPDEQAVIRYTFVDLTPSALVDAFASCDAAMQRVAEAEGIPFIETYEAIPTDLEYFADHVHLTPNGSALLAQVVGEQFDIILQGATQGTDD